LALLCTTAISAQATTITVTNTNDSGPASLRQALADVSDGDTIDFAVTGTIGLTTGELLVDKSVTISGPGAAMLAVDGNLTSRVFHVNPGKSAWISGLTLIHGYDALNGGGVLNDHAVLTMESCAVQNSSAHFNHGGGIYNDGSGGSATLSILNSTVSENYAYYAGGGIYNDASKSGSATLAIMNSTVSNNSAGFSDIGTSGGEGGGIYNGGGALMITNSSVSGNNAGAPDPFPIG
jgi:hypothetical protein